MTFLMKLLVTLAVAPAVAAERKGLQQGAGNAAWALCQEPDRLVCRAPRQCRAMVVRMPSRKGIPAWQWQEGALLPEAWLPR